MARWEITETDGKQYGYEADKVFLDDQGKFILFRDGEDHLLYAVSADRVKSVERGAA